MLTSQTSGSACWRRWLLPEDSVLIQCPWEWTCLFRYSVLLRVLQNYWNPTKSLPENSCLVLFMVFFFLITSQLLLLMLEILYPTQNLKYPNHKPLGLVHFETNPLPLKNIRLLLFTENKLFWSKMYRKTLHCIWIRQTYFPRQPFLLSNSSLTFHSIWLLCASVS